MSRIAKRASAGQVARGRNFFAGTMIIAVPAAAVLIVLKEIGLGHWMFTHWAVILIALFVYVIIADKKLPRRLGGSGK